MRDSVGGSKAVCFLSHIYVFFPLFSNCFLELKSQQTCIWNLKRHISIVYSWLAIIDIFLFVQSIGAGDGHDDHFTLLLLCIVAVFKKWDSLQPGSSCSPQPLFATVTGFYLVFTFFFEHFLQGIMDLRCKMATVSYTCIPLFSNRWEVNLKTFNISIYMFRGSRSFL